MKTARRQELAASLEEFHDMTSVVATEDWQKELLGPTDEISSEADPLAVVESRLSRLEAGLEASVMVLEELLRESSPQPGSRSDGRRNSLSAYTSSGAAEFLGVSVASIRRWSDSGKLAVYRTPGNQRRFRHEDLIAALRPEQD